MCLADGGARRRGWNKAWSGLAKVPPWLTAAVPMENPYCSCKLTELVGSRAKALDALVYTELIEPLAGVGTYIYIYAWAILRHDGPNRLGLWCNAAPWASNGRNHLGFCVRQT